MKEEMVWKILEIEPTNDEEAIRNAYRAKLVVTNPEDDQEGFMELKEAYDRALELAAGDGNDEEENEYSEIIARVDAIYKDINKRMDVSCWKELLSDPVFTSLDEQDDVRREFLELFPISVLKNEAAHSCHHFTTISLCFFVMIFAACF